MQSATKRTNGNSRPRRVADTSPISTLAEVSIALSASRDPDRVLELVAQSAERLFGCERAAIALLRDDSHQRLELAYASGLSENFLDVIRGWLTTTPGRLDALSGTEPELIPNLARSEVEADHRKQYLAEGIKALVVLPLLTQGDMVGTLTLYFPAPRRFLRADLELLRSYGSLAGLAIANARLYAGIEQALIRHSQQLQALKAVNRELNATLDLQRLLEVVIERAMSYTGAKSACLFLLEPEKQRLVPTLARGYDDEVLKLHEGRSTLHKLALRAQRAAGPEVLADVQADPDYVASGNPNRSHLSVPVRHESVTLGVITLEDTQVNLFTDDHVGFVLQLAAQTAIALTNARLFAEVSENHDRLRAVLNSTREGVLVIDAAGRIALVNPRIEEWWQISGQELLGQNLADLIQRPALGIAAKLGFSPAELLELLINLSQNLDVQPSKYIYHLEEPVLRYLERSGTPVIDEQQRVIGWVLVLRDVTEEKQTELAREELTNMVVHDLRSPMTTVLGSLKLIEDVYAGKDDTGFLQEALAISLRSSKRMVALVDSLLDIFKTESGAIEIIVRSHSLSDLAINIVEEFATFATLTEIKLVNDVPYDLPSVVIDSEKIERVVTNLIDNALKFTPADGTVTLKARVGEDPITGHCLLIEVSDTGPGIPAEYMDRVFDRYVRVVGREGRRRGTGLGLAFCRLAVEAHRGRIWVESPEEGGSAFRFTLPLVKPE
jgi:two-component system, NtrC family, sensor histidine kinase KinB